MKTGFNLKDKLSKLPKKPGVYIYKDSTGKIIYIGKALSLKHRVSSYFNKNISDPKTKVLVSNIADIKHIVVSSEFEALLLEAQLIKQHQPKYNIQQKNLEQQLTGEDYGRLICLIVIYLHQR